MKQAAWTPWGGRGQHCENLQPGFLLRVLTQPGKLAPMGSPDGRGTDALAAGQGHVCRAPLVADLLFVLLHTAGSWGPRGKSQVDGEVNAHTRTGPLS